MSEYAILRPGDEDAWEQSSPEQREAGCAVHRASTRLLQLTGGDAPVEVRPTTSGEAS